MFRVMVFNLILIFNKWETFIILCAYLIVILINYLNTSIYSRKG